MLGKLSISAIPFDKPIVMTVLLFMLIIGIVILAIRGAITGGAQLAQIPPEQLRTLAEAGIDPSIFAGPAGGGLAGALCCTFFLFIGAGLGAVGGAIWGNSRPN